jgi:ATP-dependent Clp protease protease subunit
MKEQLNKIMAQNCGITTKKIEKDTERDNFMSAKEAVDYGLIDEVLIKSL